MTYKKARQIIYDHNEHIIDMSHVCELAHQYAKMECFELNIKFGSETRECGYTKKAEIIFRKHYKIITEILGV